MVIWAGQNWLKENVHHVSVVNHKAFLAHHFEQGQTQLIDALNFKTPNFPMIHHHFSSFSPLTWPFSVKIPRLFRSPGASKANSRVSLAGGVGNSKAPTSWVGWPSIIVHHGIPLCSMKACNDHDDPSFCSSFGDLCKLLYHVWKIAHVTWHITYP